MTPSERAGEPLSRTTIDVEISGLLRGAEVSGAATVTLTPPNLELHTTRRLIVIRIDSVEGFERRDDILQLHLSWGDVIELRAGGGRQLDEFVERLSKVALALPELTVSLRSYGSPRAGAGAEQDAFFAPLRTVLNGAASLAAAADAVALFGAEQLARELGRQLTRMAAARYPEHPPERRALEAELVDCAATVHRRLDILREAQQAFAASPGSQRFAAWRRWTDALLDVFSAHDACWPLVRVALGAAPPVAPESGGALSRWRGRAREDER